MKTHFSTISFYLNLQKKKLWIGQAIVYLSLIINQITYGPILIKVIGNEQNIWSVNYTIHTEMLNCHFCLQWFFYMKLQYLFLYSKFVNT